MEEKMKILKYFIIGMLILLIVPKGQSQQVPQFSQYLFNPVYINPAYTGYKQDLFVQSYFRKQWVGIEGAPESFGFSGDVMLNSQNIGIGLSVMADKIGLQTTQSFQANLAYHLQIGRESYLSFATGMGVVNYRMKSEGYNPTVIDDPSLDSGLGNILYPDLRIGLLFYSNYFFAGISIDHALENILNITDRNLVVSPKRSYSFSIGGYIDASDRLLIKPSLLAMNNFREKRRLDLNLFFLYDEIIGLGVGHRRSFNFFREDLDGNKNIGYVLITEIQLTEKLRFSYSYDHPTGGFLNADSHELSVGFLFTSPRSRLRSPRYF